MFFPKYGMVIYDDLPEFHVVCYAWNYQVKFGEPTAEPEEHNEALAATCSNTAQSPADLEQTMLGESFAVLICLTYS